VKLTAVQKDARIKARKGARLLDRKRPGWFKKVAFTRLDMNVGSSCIVGQVWQGEFNDGLRELGFDPYMDTYEDFGFGGELYDKEDPAASSVLAEAWIGEIRKRRQKKAKEAA
jgi:hypothetical protein